MSKPPHCPVCGYTKKDSAIWMDHHLCKGKIPERPKMKPKKKTNEPVESDYREPVAHLLERLDFAPENVVASAAEQPGLYRQAIDYRMGKHRGIAQAKMALEVTEADVSIEYRRQAKVIGDKLTEGSLSELVITNKAVQELRKQKQEAEEADEFSKLLLEAFRMRRDCLKIVGELMGSELANKAYLDNSTESLKRTKEQLRNKYPGAQV